MSLSMTQHIVFEIWYLPWTIYVYKNGRVSVQSNPVSAFLVTCEEFSNLQDLFGNLSHFAEFFFKLLAFLSVVSLYNFSLSNTMEFYKLVYWYRSKQFSQLSIVSRLSNTGVSNAVDARDLSLWRHNNGILQQSYWFPFTKLQMQIIKVGLTPNAKQSLRIKRTSSAN